jgi:hypothetical protein
MALEISAIGNTPWENLEPSTLVTKKGFCLNYLNYLNIALVLLTQIMKLEHTTIQKKPSAVGYKDKGRIRQHKWIEVQSGVQRLLRQCTCSIVGQTNFKTISWQLMGIGSSKYHITCNACKYNLCSDVLVGLR